MSTINLQMPRKYSRTSSRATTYTKEALKLALEAINNKELTYAAASKMYGIPTSTLNDRVLKKTAIVSKTLGRPTAIPVELEEKLANCLRTLEKWGWGLSRAELLDVTQEFIKRNDIKTPFKNGRPGPDWFINFRKRHNLSIKKPQPVEYLRKKMTDPFIIHEYFTLLEKTLLELNISNPKQIWNLDETSVCLDPTKTKVVGARGEPCTRTTSGSAKENITVLTTVNAAGQKLDPLIVFKGKHMYEQWTLQNSKKYDFNLAYAASKRGWMETSIFYDYILKVFIPNLGEERPVLLLYDGHVSHVDDKVVALAVENDITILKLPAHTSHLLQPLDLAVFKSFKTIWDKNLVKWQRQNIGMKLRKQSFAEMFAEAWQETKPQAIQNGFKKGGIYPFNPLVIPRNKFSPAAYARWQKHNMTSVTPKTLIQICIDAISKIMSPTSEHKCSPLKPIATFEQILLEKVSQNPQNARNNIAVKLKRIAKGAEVITKSFLEKQQATESTKEKEIQKTTKRKQKTVLQSENYATDPIPGPSGLKKGKGVGKRSEDRHDEHRKRSVQILDEKSGEIMTKIPMKKRKRSDSSTSIDSVIMSVHSDSDLIDSLSDILSDCDKLTDFNYYEENKTDLELTFREQEIEKIIKEIHDIDNNQQKKASQRDNTCEDKCEIEKTHKIETDTKANNKNKVTILSSVKLTPENQAFYKILPKDCQLIDKDLDLFKSQNQKLKQSTSLSNVPKKKTKKVDCPTKIIKRNQRDVGENFCINMDKDDDSVVKNDIDDSKIYNIGDTVLVRYFKRTWTYYVGIIEDNNFNSNPYMYKITFYRTVGKKNTLKFVRPKRKDQDYVPDSNIVKVIELLQINENPVEYTLMNDDDEIFF
uniref:HTH psq-type domain-containing protein n=1 Tax=Heliothis virescens TaxID=7102 RepID=A0A2A4K184_HELVI